MANSDQRQANSHNIFYNTGLLFSYGCTGSRTGSRVTTLTSDLGQPQWFRNQHIVYNSGTSTQTWLVLSALVTVWARFSLPFASALSSIFDYCHWRFAEWTAWQIGPSSRNGTVSCTSCTQASVSYSRPLTYSWCIWCSLGIAITFRRRQDVAGTHLRGTAHARHRGTLSNWGVQSLPAGNCISCRSGSNSFTSAIRTASPVAALSEKTPVTMLPHCDQWGHRPGSAWCGPRPWTLPQAMPSDFETPFLSLARWPAPCSERQWYSTIFEPEEDSPREISTIAVWNEASFPSRKCCRDSSSNPAKRTLWNTRKSRDNISLERR